MIVHTARPDPKPSATYAADAAPARLPLYLYGRSATQVGVDGPALLVRRAGKSPARFPFARIARVISGPSVEWTAKAIVACLEQHLPIVFLDRVGQPAGYLHATQSKPSRLDDLVLELLDRPDGLPRYEQWLRAERMRTLNAWRDSRVAAGQPIDQAEFQELTRRHVYHREPHPLGLAGESLYQSAVQAYALERVQRAGAKPIYWGQHGRPLRLAEDLADLLLLSLALELRGLGSAVHGEDAALLTVLHTYGHELAERSTRLLGRLHRYIQELLEEWH